MSENLVGTLNGGNLTGTVNIGPAVVNEYELTVTDITGGHRLTIQKGNTVQTIDLLDGEDGAIGAQGPKGDTGQTGATGPQGPAGANGQNGSDGADGFSPTVTVVSITGGHRVTITDASGAHTFDVMDGQAVDIIDDMSTTTNKVWSSSKVNTELGGKAAAAHTHDDRYYTESETDTLLSGKAASVHTHAQGDVTGLTDALAGKAASVHTHEMSAVNGLNSALSGKADTLHTHEMSGVTGLADALNGKQATIADLATIRSGAAAGATALQEVPNTYRTAAAQDVIDAGKVAYTDKLSQITGAMTVSEQKAACSNMGAKYDGQFELIEEITLTEDVWKIERNTDLNGNPYRFKSIKIECVFANDSTVNTGYGWIRPKYNDSGVIFFNYYLFSMKLPSNNTLIFVLDLVGGFPQVCYYCVAERNVYPTTQNSVYPYIYNLGVNADYISYISFGEFVYMNLIAGTKIRIYAVRK